MSNNSVEMVVNCTSWQQAQRVADALLEKQLAQSIETFKMAPRSFWQSHHHGVQDVKLMIIADRNNFANIENLTRKVIGA